MTLSRIVILLVALAPAPSSAPAHADEAPSPAELGFYVAIQLDEQGQLDKALPLYAARARETLTQHDRLRYAAALLRAGQPEGAKAVFDRLASEVGSVEHGSAGRAYAPAICASTALLAGSPAVAVPYAHAASAAERRDAGRRLLLVRALVAAGEPAAARPLLAGLAGEAGDWGDGPRIELARAELAGDRPEDALARLRILAGHNHRFREPVAALARALATERRGVTPAVAALGAALAESDRSVDFVTQPLVETFGEAAEHAAQLT